MFAIAPGVLLMSVIVCCHLNNWIDMVDIHKSKVFRFDCVLEKDVILSRKHRYLLYQSKPKNHLVFECYKLNEALKAVQCRDWPSDLCLVHQFLGADGFFHTFSREYFPYITNQISLNF